MVQGGWAAGLGRGEAPWGGTRNLYHSPKKSAGGSQRSPTRRVTASGSQWVGHRGRPVAGSQWVGHSRHPPGRSQRADHRGHPTGGSLLSRIYSVLNYLPNDLRRIGSREAQDIPADQTTLYSKSSAIPRSSRDFRAEDTTPHVLVNKNYVTP